MDKKNFLDYRMEDFLTDESFINYCFHKNAADELFWKEWFLLYPEKTLLEQEAKEMLQMLSLTLPENEYRAELERMRTSIESEVIPLAKTPSIGRFLNWKKVAGAAAVLIFCIGGYLLFQNSRSNSPALMETYNRENIPLVFTLSDNTIVTLAAHSSLRYPSNFGNSERNVYLTGEADFSVSHDASHPFKVYEDDLTTTMLGTVFHVRKDFQHSTITVELRKGRVKVETSDAKGAVSRSVLLNPNEKVVYNTKDKVFNKELMFVSTRHADKMIFKYDDFSTISGKFKDAFGVTLINQSKKTNWRFTGEFENVTANELIENICLAENLHYESRNDTIVVK